MNTLTLPELYTLILDLWAIPARTPADSAELAAAMTVYAQRVGA